MTKGAIGLPFELLSAGIQVTDYLYLQGVRPHGLMLEVGASRAFVGTEDIPKLIAALEKLYEANEKLMRQKDD